MPYMEHLGMIPDKIHVGSTESSTQRQVTSLGFDESPRDLGRWTTKN